MQQPETRYVERPDGVNIAYQVFGDGPIDLLVSPGMVSHLDLAWTDPDLTRFRRRLASFARVVIYDKPGTGLSDPVMHVPTLEERAEDIRVVLDEAGMERAALFGYSEGASACVLFAATHPERVEALVLYGSIAVGNPQADLLDDPAAKDAQRRMNEAMLDMGANWGQGKLIDYMAPSVADRMQRAAAATFERAAASPTLVRGLMESWRHIDVRAVLRAVSAPTLVLHHTEELIPVFNATILADGIEGAELRVLDGRDHAFWFSDFEESVSEVERFLTGSAGASSPERALATVLFTDIVDSTRRASELGDEAWRQLLERHDRVVREQVADHGGRVVKSLGDGTLAVFDGPARAIRCAREIRAELEGMGMAVRAGVHTGECELLGDDVGGLAVHIGARVGAQASEGEILVSSTVADLVVGSGLQFAKRGEHELKGVPGRWRLLAVEDEVERPSVPLEPRPAAADLPIADQITMRVARRAPGALRAASDLGRRRAARRRP